MTISATPEAPATHPGEPHDNGKDKLNRLRAGVLGANDGIVSTAAVVVGVAGATSAQGPVFTAGLAALVGGAVSMALGEYVSVSSQRDSERAQLAEEERELAEDPVRELHEIERIYRAKGLSPETAATVARELSDHDALAAHADAELHIDPDALANPWSAALASAVSFLSGAVLPLLAAVLPPEHWRVTTIVLAVLAALAISGVLSAKLGGSRPGRPVLRVVLGGALALGITYAVGRLFGTAVG